jgi:citrate/tricarballylate utilization protein
MAIDRSPVAVRSIDIGARTSLHMLVEEASRQLDICNACRYCEGFCAVFPALERRTVLSQGDVSQIANLCHDCRACYDACMYTEPHDFDLNVPKVLSAVRVADYRRYVWPRSVPRLLSGWSGVFAGAVVAVAVVLIVAVINVGFSGLLQDPAGSASPYALIPYPVLLVMMLAPAVFAVVVMGAATRTYWREVGGAPPGRSVPAAAWRAVGYAASLRYLRGGGGDCYYPEDELPSPARRHLHGMVAYGFGLCLVSTVSAGIMQDFLGIDPPYALVSVPVLSGLVGGIGLAAGCLGLLVLKARSSDVTSFAQMTIKDYGFLVSLLFLALTGLATLFTRTTPAYGLVLIVHLAAIGLTFAAAPYSKFVHLIYRFLALVRDNLERAAG